MYSCQICKKKFKTEYVKNILPTFRHLDFKKIDNSISYKKCSIGRQSKGLIG